MFARARESLLTVLMKVFSGIAVSPGVVAGPAMVLGSENFRIPRKMVSRDAVVAELHRFHVALSRSAKTSRATSSSFRQLVGLSMAPSFRPPANGAGSAVDS